MPLAFTFKNTFKMKVPKITVNRDILVGPPMGFLTTIENLGGTHIE
jgi:hypothetical protein